ncbi:uncharacterized protein K489DRAFT_391897 [Dissoconium aciculare CBS 342.82]|uniref:HIG1 domain-containing protein n=1 Tax=Dissoconium aciculare CBS 342.82 TaxID=1314786 RepID=A0A6J3MHG6_9PEZI|nr:uncharacterized protein K489DRAFT_391897 [Dissoconium aciculare CBS 342.82]KAF1827396.1 hypothetical protein K489DRAFT_391897 [Dissoconium aciculare CBS 342.82]
MKILTAEQEAAHYNATLKGGAIGGVAGTILGTAGVYAASVRYPAFKSLTLPFRVFLIASSGTFASIVYADRYSRQFETDNWAGKEYRDEQKSMQEQIDSQKSSKQKSMEWLQDNRYSLVFGSWVVSMGAALGIVGRSRWLTTQQKLVQARVYAQGFTIAAVIISLAFEGNDRMAGSGRWETIKIVDPNDPEHKNLIEKRIHHEKYKGEDQWMDMVEAEERRIKEREQAVKERENAVSKKDGHKNGKKHATEDLTKGNPEEAKDKKLRAP